MSASTESILLALAKSRTPRSEETWINVALDLRTTVAEVSRVAVKYDVVVKLNEKLRNELEGLRVERDNAIKPAFMAKYSASMIKADNPLPTKQEIMQADFWSRVKLGWVKAEDDSIGRGDDWGIQEDTLDACLSQVPPLTDDERQRMGISVKLAKAKTTTQRKAKTIRLFVEPKKQEEAFDKVTEARNAVVVVVTNLRSDEKETVVGLRKAAGIVGVGKSSIIYACENGTAIQGKYRCEYMKAAAQA